MGSGMNVLKDYVGSFSSSGIETSKEKLLESAIGSSIDGFVNYTGLLNFEDELDLLREYGIEEGILSRLKNKAIKSSFGNLYALCESSMKFGGFDSVKYFANYRNEAFNITEGYNLNRENIFDKFNEIWRSY